MKVDPRRRPRVPPNGTSPAPRAAKIAFPRGAPEYLHQTKRGGALEAAWVSEEGDEGEGQQSHDEPLLDVSSDVV